MLEYLSLLKPFFVNFKLSDEDIGIEDLEEVSTNGLGQSWMSGGLEVIVISRIIYHQISIRVSFPDR